MGNLCPAETMNERFDLENALLVHAKLDAIPDLQCLDAACHLRLAGRLGCDVSF